MNFQSYLNYFETILKSETPLAPYDNPDYLDYTRLNWSRMNRWLKKGVLQANLTEAIKGIDTPQHWIVITEPWCGDAAHAVPFIQLASELNPLISVDYELRDASPFRIEQYLTNSGKSIPKLIIQDATRQDLAVWGPRPVACQSVFDQLKADGADFETQKIALQQWYNDDKGKAIQGELLGLL